MSIDPRDALLQAHTPVVIVPRFGELAPLDKPGHRYLVAQDGLWLEVRRAWLRAQVLLGANWQGGGWHDLPFGELDQAVEYAFGAEQLQKLQALFLYDAKNALPNEFAAWGVYSERTGRVDYRALLADRASPGGISFQRPRLEDHEHLAVDLHSHGAGLAFFSETDDEDDRGEVKVAMVAGSLDAETSWASRLCLLGVYVHGDEAADEDLREIPV